MGAVDGFRGEARTLLLPAREAGANQYVVDGNAKVVNASYAIEYFWIDGANATTHLHITPDEIVLPDLVGRPRQGGIVNAALRYVNWSAPFRTSEARRRGPSHEHSRPRARRPPDHRTRKCWSPPYRNLGFDTAGEGTVNVDWTGRRMT